MIGLHEPLRMSGLTATCTALVVACQLTGVSAYARTVTYLNDTNAGVINVVDSRERLLTTTIPVCASSPVWAMALTPDRRRLWAGCYRDGYAVEIDTASNTVLGSVAVKGNPLGSGVIGVAISLDGKQVFLANAATYAIDVVDSGLREVIFSIDLGYARNYQVAVVDDRTLYVLREWEDIAVVDLVDRRVVKTIVPSSLPRDLVLDRMRGKAYVTNTSGPEPEIYRIDTTTHSVDASLDMSGASGASGLTITPDGMTLLTRAGDGLALIEAPTLRTFEIIPSWGISGISFTPDSRYAYLPSYLRTPGSGAWLTVLDLVTHTYEAPIHRVGLSLQRSLTAEIESQCGDSHLDEGEACDDGNRIGGDGCALDCTAETSHVMHLDPIHSVAKVQTRLGDFTGSIQGTLGIRAGRAAPERGYYSNPIALVAEDFQIAPISVGGFGCLCLRPRSNPAWGPDTVAHGDIPCGEDLVSYNYSYRMGVTHGGYSPDKCGLNVGRIEGSNEPHPGICQTGATPEFFGVGVSGEVALVGDVDAWLILDGGSCAADENDERLGPDHEPCTNDDLAIGTAKAIPALVSGHASTRIHQVDATPWQENLSIVAEASGAPVECALLEAGDADALRGTVLVGAVPFVDSPIGDFVLSVVLAGEPVRTPTPSPSPTQTRTPVPPFCPGDCDESRVVTTDEIAYTLSLVTGQREYDAEVCNNLSESNGDLGYTFYVDHLVTVVNMAAAGHCPVQP